MFRAKKVMNPPPTGFNPTSGQNRLLMISLFFVSFIATICCVCGTLALVNGGHAVQVTGTGEVDFDRPGVYGLWVNAHGGNTTTILKKWAGVQMVKVDGEKNIPRLVSFLTATRTHNGDRRLRVCSFEIRASGKYRLARPSSVTDKDQFVQIGAPTWLFVLTFLSYPITFGAFFGAAIIYWRNSGSWGAE